MLRFKGVNSMSYKFDFGAVLLLCLIKVGSTPSYSQDKVKPETIEAIATGTGTQVGRVRNVLEGMYAIKSCEPAMDKIIRMHSVTSTIENGFVYLPDKACWLAETSTN